MLAAINSAIAPTGNGLGGIVAEQHVATRLGSGFLSWSPFSG